MNYYIEQHDMELILDALEHYKLDNEHEHCWTTGEIDQLYNYLIDKIGEA